MHLVDNVEAAWRALFNYYTPFAAVEALHESGVHPEEARFVLDTMKAERQKIYAKPLYTPRGHPIPYGRNES